MRARIVGQASTMIATLIIVVSVAIVTQLSLSLQNHQAHYVVQEGMWPVVEQERSLLLLREIVKTIYLGGASDDYQLRRGIAFSRVEIIRDFSQGNPTFDGGNQRSLLVQLQEHMERYERIEQSKVPDSDMARRLLPSIDAAVEVSHDLVNIRRDAIFDANIQTFGMIQRLQISQIVTLILLILIGIGFFYRNRAATKRLRMTMLQAEDLAIANERTRVAREIHDGLGHYLDEVHMHLGAAWMLRIQEPDTADDSLKIARDRMIVARQELRRAIHALHADYLAGPLEELLAHPMRTCQLGGICTNLHIQGMSRSLSEAIKQVLYRTTQEALTNVRKHAQASRVDVWLDYRQPKQVRLIIEDDGNGVPPQGGGGRGLVGLRERVELVDGQFRIDAKLGQGYTIEIEVAG